MSPPTPSTRRRLWAVALVWGLAAYTFHAIGNANGLYVRHWWFQIVAHYWSATALAGLLALTGLSGGLRGRRLAAFVVALTVAGALSWEVVEYLGVFPHLHFHGLGDSLVDVTADAVGLWTVLALLRRRDRSTRGGDASATPAASTPADSVASSAETAD
jgi:hypothetical protein